MRHLGSARGGGIAFFAVILLMVAGAHALQNPPAPLFALKDLAGDEVALKDILGGGPILISFWATWCKPCLKELPHLQKLYETLGERGLKLLAISQDSPRSLSKVRSFIEGHRYTFTVLLDPNGKVSRKFITRGIPHTVLLNPEGEIVFERMGYRPGDEKILHKMIVEMLPAPKDTAGQHGAPPLATPRSDEGSPEELHGGDQ